MGLAGDRHDSEGHEKIQCELCKMWFHMLDVHLSNFHKGINIAEYKKRFPGKPTRSEYAIERTRAAAAARSGVSSKPKLEKSDHKVDIVSESLGVSDVAVETSAAISVEPFHFGVATVVRRNIEDLTPYDRGFIPVHDEKWTVGPSEDRALEELALAIQDNENVLIVGPPGVGKTTLVRELAAMLDQPLRRCPFNGEMRLSSLIGSKDLRVDSASGQTITTWTNGPLPDSAERGHWFLADEFDSAPPPVTFVMHPVLEEHRQLTLMERDGGHEVQFHKMFRFIATANTLGYGDDTGLYAGTGPMNEALLDRFQTVIRLDYPTPEAELKMLQEKAEGIRESWASSMVEIANKVRAAQKMNETQVSISPRRLIAWARKTVRFNDPARAAAVSLIGKLPEDDAKYIGGIVQRVFGSLPSK